MYALLWQHCKEIEAAYHSEEKCGVDYTATCCSSVCNADGEEEMPETTAHQLLAVHYCCSHGARRQSVG
jgi:hypothetical protein